MHWKKGLPKNPYCKTMVWYSVQCVSQEVIDGYHIFLEWTSSLYGNFLVWLINKPWYVNSDICLESQIMSVILCKAWDVFFGYFVMEKKNTSPSACCSLGNYRQLIFKSLSWKILSVIENLIIYFNFIDCNFLFFLQRYHPK